MRVENVNDLSSLILSNGGLSQKLIIAKSPDEDLAEIENYINEKFKGQLIANSGAPTILEIISTAYTKYTASKFIAEMLGVSEDETVTIGDSSNDLTLIEFGLGCAVADGSKELIAEADYVAPPIAQMPVKHIIDKILSDEDLV
jgi:hydroxymethylpyrimidine pyrophosphatase-like HAD family hydrolase